MFFFAGMLGLFAVGNMLLDFEDDEDDPIFDSDDSEEQTDAEVSGPQVDMLTGQPIASEGPDMLSVEEDPPETGGAMPAPIPVSEVTAASGLEDADEPEPDQILQGGDQDDEITGGSGDDQINGEDGDDKIAGGEGTDRLHGADGDDTLRGGEGDDILRGGEGGDTLHGDAGDDQLFGYGGDDTLSGGEGNDTAEGGQGNDHLLGGEGQDGLLGGHGDDTLDGGEGSDTLFGGWGNDTLTGVEQGEQASDFLNGGGGDDTITAGAGDYVTSGDGSDLVILGDWIAGQGAAEILDFSPDDDKLALGWDLTADPDPTVEITTDPQSPGQSNVVVNGSVIAILHGATPPHADDILLVDQAVLGQMTSAAE